MCLSWLSAASDLAQKGAVQDPAGNWVRDAGAASLAASLQPRAPVQELPIATVSIHSIDSLLWRLTLTPPQLPTDYPPGLPFPFQLSLAHGRTVLLQQAVQVLPADVLLPGPGLAVQPLAAGNVTAGATVQLLLATDEPGQHVGMKLLMRSC